MSKNNEHTVFTIESVTVIKILALVSVFLLGISFLHAIVEPLILILVAAFLALALNPAVAWISNKLPSRSRIQATGVAYLIVITFLVLFCSIVFPPLIRQTVDFVQDVPSTIQDLKQGDTPFSRFVYKYNLDEQVDHFTSDFGSRFGDIGKAGIATASKIGTTVISIVTVFVLTFMMLVEGPLWLDRYFKTLNKRRKEHHQRLARKMYRVVVGYVNGQVFIAGLGGTFAAITLFIMSQIFDVSVNAVALGGIVALFALLPLIGTILGAVIVILSTLFVSTPLAIAVTIYFIIYQQIENVTIQPYVQSRSNNLTPLIVFTAALLGIGLGGILGAIFAIPIAGCIKVLVEDHFEGRTRTTAMEKKEIKRYDTK
jgi:predicted PurR-regulated permease PerM